MDRQFKRTKTGAVQLTSLLDLLFVMIFVSLLQQKEVSPQKPKPTPVAKTKVEKPKPKPVPKKILSSVNATFDFSLAGYKGKYLMEGLYNEKTGSLNLASLRWIDKPSVDIGMVPLSGKVTEDKMQFTGRVEFEGCKTFDLKRIKIESGSPIAGVWKGSYVCAQGSTNLTLTID